MILYGQKRCPRGSGKAGWASLLARLLVASVCAACASETAETGGDLQTDDIVIRLDVETSGAELPADDSGAADAELVDTALVDAGLADAGADGLSNDAQPGDTVDAGEPDAGPDGYAYLVVEPAALDFGSVAPGLSVTQSLELENAGTLPLVIDALVLENGSESFGVNLQAATLEPGEKKQLFVIYIAVEEGDATDVLQLHSNAANAPIYGVPLAGSALGTVCQDLDGDLHGIGCAAGGDCNESDPTVHVGAVERCNGLDDDCDGLHDEDYLALGESCAAGTGACVTDGVKVCAPDEFSLMCSVNVVTGGSELCNEVDDDCDGATDEDFPSKGKPCLVGTGACAAFDKYVCTADGTALVCNVTPGTPSTELCGDGIDNDCDGITDEGELETCGDLIDNDCDGETDESGGTFGDLFFARGSGYSVEVFPVKPGAEFAPPVTLTFPDDDHYGPVGVGDFDGDGFLDLVVAEIDVEGATLCSAQSDCPGGRCWGGICTPTCTSDAQCPDGRECIDSHPNNDPALQYCVPTRRILLVRTACDGDELSMTHLFDLHPGESVAAMIDADNNGHLDFILRYPWAAKATATVLNDGQGNFSRIESSLDISPMFDYEYYINPTSKDLDGDGIVDLVGSSFANGGSPPTVIWYIRGNGDGTFQPPVKTGTNAPYPGNMVTANDFDGDGDQDIVVALDDDGNPGAGWMLLNLEAPDGKSWAPAYPIFDVAPNYNSGGDHPGWGRGVSYDFNGDKRPDILAVWTPEECGSYLWNCPAITNPAHPCYQGRCKKIGYMENKTGAPCPVGTLCLNGQCQAGCEADCTGKACGSDGCGGSCGTCGGGQLCASGQCVVDCVPSCGGKTCGPDGCGGVCGECQSGEACVAGACTVGCVPSCNGKQCGDDGCGGTCAVFEAPQIVSYDNNATITLLVPTNVPPTPPTVALQPGTPAADQDLTCAVVVPSYDLDAVTYRTRWYRNGDFVPSLSGPVVPAILTTAGDTWRCVVRATDGVEWSPPVEALVEVGAAP